MKKNEATEIIETATTAVTTVETDNKQCFLMADSSHVSYTSLVPETFEEKKAFFNLVNTPTKPLKEMINLTIDVQHIYAETCTYVDKQTGELTPGVRIVLIDKDNVSYNTSSKGVFNALTKLFQIFGEPRTWTSPIPIRVKQISVAADRNVLTLETA